MTTRSRDMVVIAVALFVILGCGFGIGSAFAPRRAEVAPPPPEVPVKNFERAAFTNLDAELDLTPEQEEAILSALAETSGEIHAARREALLRYHLAILKFHDRIESKLAPDQKEKLQKNRLLLQDTIEKRFGISLDEIESAPGGGSPDSE